MTFGVNAFWNRSKICHTDSVVARVLPEEPGRGGRKQLLLRYKGHLMQKAEQTPPEDRAGLDPENYLTNAAKDNKILYH